MTRQAWVVWLAGTFVAAAAMKATNGDEIAINYSKIKYEYVEQEGGGISFGGASAFPALPADFFGPGSEPYSGDVVLKGKKILQNLVAERTEPTVFDPPSAAQDIRTELVELSLQSVDPIVVTYSDGLTELWDMTINLDRNEQSSCWIRVSQGPAGDPDGGAILTDGTYMDLFAEITFTHGPIETATRFRYFAIVDRSHLATTDAKWADRNDSIAGGMNREFIPGADPANPSAPPQVLMFDGGGLDLPLRVVDVVPEPSALVLALVGVSGLGWRAPRRCWLALQRKVA